MTRADATTAAAERITPDPATPRGAAATHRRADIQGIRAVAVVLTVLYHGGVAVPGGFVGVDVFFVVSGYVICAMLLRELATTGRIRLGAFYVRRVRRLLPALALVTGAVLVAAALLLSPLGDAQATTGRAAAATSIFAGNAYFYRYSGGYFQPVAENNPLLHTWSLAVEEQFYLVFPALLLLAWRLKRRRPAGRPPVLAGLALGGAALSLAVSVCLAYGWIPHLLGSLATSDHGPSFGFYAPVGRAWEFLAGALVAGLGTGRVLPRAVRQALAAAGALLLAAAALGLSSADPYPGWLALLPVAATVALLLAGPGPASVAVTRWLSARPMVALGDLSYSWYLWHWPAIVVARACFPATPAVALTAALASLVPAVLAYHLVEQPIHRGARLASARATMALAAGCVLLPAAAGLGLAASADRSWSRPDVAAIRALVTPSHIDATAGCAQYEPLGSPLRPACTWTVAHPLGTVLLIGDSNAGQFAEPAILAARAAGYDLQITTTGGCPLLRRSQYPNESCRQYVEGSLAAIAARNPPYSAVLISNASVGYVSGNPPWQLLHLDAADRPARIAAWAADAGRTAAEVGRRGPVIFVGAIPQFPGLPTCLVPRTFAPAAAGCGHLDPATAHRMRTDVVTAERTAVEHAGATYLDLGGRLCTPSGGCSAFAGGALVYRDGAHLNVEGSLGFQAPLRDAIASSARPSPS
ncbi:acyltransferase family protein [Dactylosporangium sp. CA-092794]|uniref:acyltransferase family protein n=1 Tax=Dactylosporangium sp. CA-092794 TaxID=3239929 RepID=UPI003D8BD566